METYAEVVESALTSLRRDVVRGMSYCGGDVAHEGCVTRLDAAGIPAGLAGDYFDGRAGVSRAPQRQRSPTLPSTGSPHLQGASNVLRVFFIVDSLVMKWRRVQDSNLRHREVLRVSSAPD